MTNLKAGAALNAFEVAIANRKQVLADVKKFYGTEIGATLEKCTIIQCRSVATHADSDRKPFPDLRCVVLTANGETKDMWLNGYELSTAISFGYGEQYRSDVVGKLGNIFRDIIDADKKMHDNGIALKSAIREEIRRTIRQENIQLILDSADPDATMNELCANIDAEVDARYEAEKAKSQAVRDASAIAITAALRGIDEVDPDNLPEEAGAFDIVLATYQPKLGDKLPNGRCQYALDANGNPRIAERDWKNPQTKIVYAVVSADNVDSLTKAVVLTTKVSRGADSDWDI